MKAELAQARAAGVEFAAAWPAALEAVRPRVRPVDVANLESLRSDWAAWYVGEEIA